MKLKKHIILFIFIFIILFNTFSFALTSNEANEHLEYVISYLNDENNDYIYHDYYNSYFVYYNSISQSIFVYLFNSDNTKILIYNNLIYFIYCFSDNNLTYDGKFLGYSFYIPDTHQFNDWSNQVLNYSSMNSGFYNQSVSLYSCNILYCTQDILTSSSSVNNAYNQTLPFDINELEIYRSSDVTQEEPDEPDEPQETQPNFYDDSKLLENLKEINDNIYELNNILYVLIFIFTCWFIIDFLRHAFF